MRRALVLFLLLALLLPVAIAAPKAQSGEQTGRYWTEKDIVSVQPGTRYLLVGAPANADIFFYNAAGAHVGDGVACGHDMGMVPVGAVWAEVAVFQPVAALTGHPGNCGSTMGNGLPQRAYFVYVDGF